MLRILFLFLWIIPGFVSPANGAIEIYANGHKYNSLQEYALWKESVNNPKGKSFQASQKNLSDETLRKLYALSIENAMAGVLRNFYQTWEPSESLISRTVMLGTPATRDITPEQLQKAIGFYDSHFQIGKIHSRAGKRTQFFADGSGGKISAPDAV